MAKIGKQLQAALKEDAAPSRRRVRLTSGQAIRIAREMLKLTQPKLEKLTGIAQSTISALEHDREVLGLDRAKILAKALKVHPSVLAFPDWESEELKIAI